MSEKHFFASFSGDVSDHWRERAEAIAASHGANVVYHTDAASGSRGWMQVHNQGAPFNGQRARAVVSELVEAGLWCGETQRPINLD